MMDKAKLEALSYTSVLEALGERFRCSPRLLRRLNPGATFTRAGERLQVPNVGEALAGKAAKVVLDKSESSVEVLDASDTVIASYPATMGTVHDPLPLGAWKINGVLTSPSFFYTSHGCIRLTNWDAAELAQLVAAGTPALLQE